MAKNNLSELAQYGRNNDTEIAKTSMGELWHVTKDEKKLWICLVWKVKN